MPFNLNQLQNGIHYWHTTRWPQDFHNHFYQEIDQVNNLGLFQHEWWPIFLAKLGSWRATRPKSYTYLSNRYANSVNRIRELWNTVLLQNDIVSIENIEWNILEQFYTSIHEIKNVSSPVFASKFCHFVAPNLFPVIDNRAMGLPYNDYSEYFINSQYEWNNTDMHSKQEMHNMLVNNIDGIIYDDYPMNTKIIELCYIGRNNA